jgi:hypothetical protein
MSGKHNLVCEQGTTFVFEFTVKTGNTPWNLTNYNATFTVRPFLGSNEITTLSSTTLSNNTSMVLGTTNGKVTMTLSSSLTHALTAGKYVYDFVLDSGTVVTRLLEGKFVVTKSVN